MITQFVFVGHHKERILDSIRALRGMPVEKVVLFVGEEELPGEKKVREVAEYVKMEIKAIYEVEVAQIDKRNVLRATIQLLEAINRERVRGRDVVINASGSLRTLAIAGYIAACVTNSRIFTSIPKYDEREEEVGVEEVVEIPTLPIDFPPKEQIEILRAIDGGVDALDELVARLKPGIEKGSEDFLKERSRVSHHLLKLERIGAVRKVKVGRNVRVVPTTFGEILRRATLCRNF